MAWDWDKLACRPGKVKLKCHQTLICGLFLICMALPGVYPLSFWCRLKNFGLSIFDINIFRGLIFKEFHYFRLVNMLLTNTINLLEKKKLKPTKTAFVVSDGRPSDGRSGYQWIHMDYSVPFKNIYGLFWTLMDHYKHLWINVLRDRRLPSHHDGKAMTTSRLEGFIIILITTVVKLACYRAIVRLLSGSS